MVEQAYIDGDKLVVIAHEYGITESGVVRIVERAGIRLRSAGKDASLRTKRVPIDSFGRWKLNLARERRRARDARREVIRG